MAGSFEDTENIMSDTRELQRRRLQQLLETEGKSASVVSDVERMGFVISDRGQVSDLNRQVEAQQSKSQELLPRKAPSKPKSEEPSLVKQATLDFSFTEPESPQEEYKNMQEVALFQRLLSTPAGRDSQSNAINLLESLYAFSAGKQKGLKDRDYHEPLTPYETIVTDAGVNPIEVTIGPAYYQNSDGKMVYAFPGFTEELIMMALMKIATSLMNVHTDVELSSKGSRNQISFGVEFTLREIDKILTSIGRRRSISDIRRGIEILHRSTLTIKGANGGPSFSSHFLPELKTYKDNKFNPRSRQSHWSVRLHQMISFSISSGDYGQFNLRSIAGTKGAQDMRLRKFVYSYMRKRTMGSRILFSCKEYQEKTGELKMNRSTDGFKKFELYFKLMADSGLIEKDYKLEIVRGKNRKVIDYLITAAGTPKLYSEIKINYLKRNFCMAQLRGARYSIKQQDGGRVSITMPKEDYINRGYNPKRTK